MRTSISRISVLQGGFMPILIGARSVIDQRIKTAPKGGG